MTEHTTGEATKLVSPTLAQPQVVQHINVGQRYRVIIERAASTKGVLGYKIEVNGDDMGELLKDAKLLKQHTELMTEYNPAPEPTPSEPKEAKP